MKKMLSVRSRIAAIAVACLVGSTGVAMDLKGDSVWLDGLASIREISHKADGPVRAVFTFKNGTERESSIRPWNRVLYIGDRFGRTEKLDLARITKIDFE